MKNRAKTGHAAILLSSLGLHISNELLKVLVSFQLIAVMAPNLLVVLPEVENTTSWRLIAVPGLIFNAEILYLTGQLAMIDTLNAIALLIDVVVFGRLAVRNGLLRHELRQDFVAL